MHPAKGVNVILGGRDVGKTTILDAIALLLSPANPATLSDTGYHARAGRCRICYRSDCLLAGAEWNRPPVQTVVGLGVERPRYQPERVASWLRGCLYAEYIHGYQTVLNLIGWSI
jgi:hypothetical protein